MEGSLDDFSTLSKIDPANPHYASQIGRVLHYRMNLPRPPATSLEHFTSAVVFCSCLIQLSERNGGEASVDLSEGFTRLWPAIWKIIQSTFVPSVTQHTIDAVVRQFAR